LRDGYLFELGLGLPTVPLEIIAMQLFEEELLPDLGEIVRGGSGQRSYATRSKPGDFRVELSVDTSQELRKQAIDHLAVSGAQAPDDLFGILSRRRLRCVA
jgi:hypothetical protein